jgi:hypothetical protein
MKVVKAFIALCLISVSALAETDRPFRSVTAESVLSSCLSKAEWQRGFCLGFIEAIAVRLADTRESCTYWPVDVDPLLAEAIDALSEVDKTAQAWTVIEQRLSVKHLPPCK